MTYFQEGHMNWKYHKRQLMRNPEFVREYHALEPEYEQASALIHFRLAKGLSQEDPTS
jgi:hypothetical protein